MADQFPVGLFSTDEDGSDLLVNARWRSFAGVDPSWRPVTAWCEVVHPEDRPRIQAAWHDSLRERADFQAEFRFERPEGEPLWVLAVAHFTPGQGFSGTLMDISSRKQQEQLLSEAQRLAHLGSWEWNMATNRVTWSDEVFRIFRVPPEHFGGTLEAFLAYVHPEDRPRLAATWLGRRTNPENVAHTYRIICPDGTERVLESRGNVVTDASGKPVKAFGTIFDVTENRRLDAALQEERYKLRSIIDHTTDAVFITDQEGRYVFANQAAAENLRLTLDQVIGKTNADIFDAATLEWLQRAVPPSWDVPFPREGEYVTKDGYRAYFSLVAYPYHSRDGQRIGTIGIARDITERKREENELRRNNALLRAQEDAAIDGILAVDENNLVIGCNSQFLKLWNILPELAAQADDNLLLAYVRDQLQDPEAFLDRVRYLYDHPFETSRDLIPLKDGRVLDRYSGPIVSPEGDSYGRIWFFRDITDRIRLEEQLRERYEALQALDRLKDNFVSAVSHDLRSPLTSIKGYAEFLEEGIGGELSDKQMGYVEQIMRGSKRLENLVDDLLDFARLDAGTFKLERRSTDFGQLAQEVVDSLRPQFQDARVQVGLRRPDAPLVLPLDSHRIERVMINLLSNAIKFTPGGGSVEVHVRVEGEDVRCEVSDTGNGIDPEDLPKLFKRFSQLEYGSHKGGTGLGLSISRALVEAHSGAIGVESTPGHGAMFWFSLPMEIRPAEKAAPAAS